jgi:hypothetical protein
MPSTRAHAMGPNESYSYAQLILQNFKYHKPRASA